MQLHNRTLESLADMICGHPLVPHRTSADKPAESNFPYRSSTYLTRFFEDCDLSYSHDGSTRKWWVMKVLSELNQLTSDPDLPSPSLLRVIQELMDRENFKDEAQRAAALADINTAFMRDALLVFIDERGRAQIQNAAVPGATSKDVPKPAPWTKAQLAYRQRLTTYLDEASEDDFIDTILAPLFRALGFTRISVTGHTDKHLEFGKDLWMKLRLPTGHLIYFGCQAKRDKLDAAASGSNTNIATILKQIEMMIGHPVFDPDDNRKHLLDHCYIISAGEITKAARQYLAERLDQQARRHILFMDRTDLLDLATRVSLNIPFEEPQPATQTDDQIPF
jgi:hypothetical protein